MHDSRTVQMTLLVSAGSQHQLHMIRKEFLPTVTASTIKVHRLDSQILRSERWNLERKYIHHVICIVLAGGRSTCVIVSYLSSISLFSSASRGQISSSLVPVANAILRNVSRGLVLRVDSISSSRLRRSRNMPHLRMLSQSRQRTTTPRLRVTKSSSQAIDRASG